MRLTLAASRGSALPVAAVAVAHACMLRVLAARYVLPLLAVAAQGPNCKNRSV